MKEFRAVGIGLALVFALAAAWILAPARASVPAPERAPEVLEARERAAALPVFATGAATEETADPAGNTESRLVAFVRARLEDPACPPGLAGRTDADIRYAALGPGRHGWLVQLVETGGKIGHMIVAATPEGEFQLAACGSGDVPPDIP